MILISNLNAQAQEKTQQNIAAKSIFNLKNSRDYSNKGKIYVHWGYNFSWYAKSDIRLYGPNYDITLKDVVAKDRPTKLSLTYINPLEITIPQFNFHFGYFIKDNYSISIGWDHMKYVAQIPQTVKAIGFIGKTISNPAIPTGRYEGTYNNDDLYVDKDMLLYEHTDGFNYVSAELERYDDVWVAKNHKQSLNIETGLGGGFIIPRTDAHLFGVGANHYWNFAGYGVSAKVGARFFFTHKFYLQENIKAGWSNLTKIHTTGRNDIDNAEQKISFLENYYVVGFLF
ncbi:MAG: hypothetical protein KKE39_12475 [Bacteroidetes bacterium]|nr:hypothetical protein [Bacteroidota bacterium]MBU1373644.1 hypothetical protein [Bacteroidota bacterium]MBU1485970.1 hypothetical protein [Bacteroidota bacterium]MBU1759252.1 hypothetical protein [Bacteroidota bacterium]MBU2376333.1 hypothetical protein [Bacteroidota bacterium]